MAAGLAGLNQRLEVIQIKEAGHGVPYDQPERFSAIVQTFFALNSFNWWIVLYTNYLKDLLLKY